MAKRSRINKIADGHKATATKINRWGEEDLIRARKMRDWTIENGKDDIRNPYSRANYYRDRSA